MFYEEFKDWFAKEKKIKNKYFLKNLKNFEKTLLSLEINYLITNKNLSLELINKILTFPNFYKKIKYVVALFLPKKIINYFR